MGFTWYLTKRFSISGCIHFEFSKKIALLVFLFYFLEITQSENWKEIQESFFIQPHYLILLFAVLLENLLEYGLMIFLGME